MCITHAVQRVRLLHGVCTSHFCTSVIAVGSSLISTPKDACNFTYSFEHWLLVVAALDPIVAFVAAIVLVDGAASKTLIRFEGQHLHGAGVLSQMANSVQVPPMSPKAEHFVCNRNSLLKRISFPIR
ncbi:unnamed protein product [Toxocara canis]|uniref:G_PROTEIN_RECEP_F1_2 domain-containing protein n=1 Tax=Toxocara canis TaxID=6265 RepID=A0A183U1D3_TOXCA|nr:unnamed protein product [Toxocara canis]